jgi:radical SAM protein with 4Fe4S-binding SPASM domain
MFLWIAGRSKATFMTKDAKKPVINRVRYESFGGIISSLDPPFLAWVDKYFMRKLGYSGSPLWKSASAASPRHLSAPTEVHWAITNKCSRGCAGCYMDSRPAAPCELSTDALKTSLKLLRDLGVFHVALGGGEAFERPDFHEIVAYCREIGLVPNLTTSGLSMEDREIEICSLMGQVNISCDGVGPHYGVNGRNGSFAVVDTAIRRMKEADIPVGINCVVSRRNYSLLAEVIRYAAGVGANEVEFLKYKPSGRGRERYAENALTQDMVRGFYPMLMGCKRPASLELKIDCSFIPALLYHKPPKDQLEKCAVTGCDGGNLLLSVRSNGIFAGCSFVDNSEIEPVSTIESSWHSSVHLNRFRDVVAKAQEPCRSCEYLSICKCGCRAAALFLTGDFFAPDPECPFVVEHAARKEVR